MRSCIAVLYIAVSAGLPASSVVTGMLSALPAAVMAEAPPPAQVHAGPDRLYADRERLASAQEAAGIWAGRLAADGADFVSAWKLARARYWLGTNGLTDMEARKTALEDGIAAGRAAIAVHPDRPEGHFWVAANMGALAESFGLRQGLRYRGPIRDELQRVLALDPAFLDGSADRALGRWYHKVPGLFGGSKERSEAHLRAALAYNPDSVITRVFLAETLMARAEDAEARAQLEAALAAPLDPDWAPEDRRFKDEARRLLASLDQ